MIPGLRSGTGKSLAYILPILASIDNYSPTLQAVIVAPTRELCVQITRFIAQVNAAGKKARKLHPITVSRVAGDVKSVGGRSTFVSLLSIKLVLNYVFIVHCGHR